MTRFLGSGNPLWHEDDVHPQVRFLCPARQWEAPVVLDYPWLVAAKLRRAGS